MTRIALVHVAADAAEYVRRRAGLRDADTIDVEDPQPLVEALRDGTMEADAIVIDASLPAPLELARELHTLDANLPVLILAPEDRVPEIRRQITFSPGLGPRVTCGSRDDLPRLLDELVEEMALTPQRRRHRDTIEDSQRRIGRFEPLQGAAELYLEQILEYAPIGIVALDPDGNLTAWNAQAIRFLGTTPRPGVAFEKHLPEEARDGYRRLATSAESGPSSAVLDLGASRFVEITMAPRGAYGAILLVQDVSQRQEDAAAVRALQAEMAEQVEDLRRLLQLHGRLSRRIEMTPVLQEILRAVGALLAADHAILMLWNAAEESFDVVASLGLASDQLEKMRRYDGHCRKALQTREPVLVTDIAAERGPDRELADAVGYRAFYCTALVSRAGAVTGILAVYWNRPHAPSARQLRLVELYCHQASDFLEHARLYREAREAARAREEFLSVASHELKTPLTSLRLELDLLHRLLARKRTSDPGELLDMVQKAREQSTRLTRLINALLDFSRMSAGRLRLERETMDLAAEVREVLRRHQDAADLRPGRIDLRADEPVLGVWDRLRIGQVVTNLVANAIKYGRGKPIRVEVSRSGSHARLEVEDQGIGIEPEFLSRIFRPLERAASAESFGGLGLGLYICRQIVEAHGGKIGVRSKPGEGSTFWVELPIEEPEP